MEEFVNPYEVLSQLDLKEDMTAADFGCGSGGWTLPLAKKLKEGTVYAIDILDEPLSALKGKAQSERIFNLRPVRGNIEKERGSQLPDNSVDLVLMNNLLFQITDKKTVLGEAKRVLKKGGKILIVDWVSGNASVGPSEKEKVSPDAVKEIIGELGLKLEKEIKAGVYHYGLLFKKP